MDLKTFVSESLVQICEGIKDAQARTLGIGAYVCPKPLKEDLKRKDGTVAVEFDVAVGTVSEKDSTSGGESRLSIVIMTVFNAHIKGDSKNRELEQDTTISRLKFVVPVRWPFVEVQEGEEVDSNENLRFDRLYEGHKKREY